MLSSAAHGVDRQTITAAAAPLT